MKVLILDGQLKSALSAVRSLGEQDIHVIVGGERPSVMSASSRYVKSSFVYTSPKHNKDKFVDDLEAKAIEIGDKPIIYPFSDATAIALLRHRIRLEKVATLVLPESGDAEVAFNKKKTLELAKSLDIRIPITNMLDDLDDISALSKKLSYPAVVKPQHTASYKEGIGIDGVVKVVNSPGELTAYAAKIATETDEYPLVQTFVTGPEYGVELIAKDGEVLSHVIHKRIRSLSPRGGASVVKETVELDKLTKEMLSSSKKLVKKLSWTGVMMVEFKVQEKSQLPYLMEINPRFWGSLPLSIFAGVDFPYMYYNLALGTEVAAAEQKDGIRSRHLLGDIHHLLKVLFSSDPLREKLYPRRIDAVSDFLFGSTTRYDVMQKNDMMPFFTEIWDTIIK